MQQPVSLDCHRGEIFGLAGLMGAGRTELLEAIYGLVPRSSGSVVLCREEEQIALLSVNAAINRVLVWCRKIAPVTGFSKGWRWHLIPPSLN